MGTWGIGPFENDDAADWAADLAASRGLSLVERALKPEEVEGYYLSAPDGVRILCAGETVAALCGDPSDDLPDVVRDWVAGNAHLDVTPLVKLARRAVNRVLAEHSELAELWSEDDDDYAVWRDLVDQLRSRLCA